MVHIIPNFLVLPFGENFHENPNKNSKVTENFGENFMKIQTKIAGQLKQQMLYTANFLYAFNPIKMTVQFLKTASIFHNIDDPNAFLPNSTGP